LVAEAFRRSPKKEKTAYLVVGRSIR